ncbi:MAG: sulfur oxidation protein SoxY [Burkholderiales bacterium]|nr:sulfur oxidation protein SoxY [Burkholderiales bacterium]
MLNRRNFLVWCSGIWAGVAGLARAQTPADPLAPLVSDITGGAPLTAGRVSIDTPRLADNGHSVPLKVSVDNPMTAASHVRSITLLSPRNPRPLIAKFMLGPHAGRAEVSTRVRLNGSQVVLAIAQLSDGTFWSGTAEVEVTESACLDAG